MFTKYRDPQTVEYKMLYDWAANHKTMICLNGGNQQSVTELWGQIESIGNWLGFPTQKFHEDAQSLGGIITTCGIILPPEVYDYDIPLDQDSQYVKVRALISSFNLAK